MRLVKLFCEDFCIALVDKEEVSQWFYIKTVVKRGCKEVLLLTNEEHSNGLKGKFTSPLLSSTKHQLPVVQLLDSAIHRINHYPAGKYEGN